LLALRGCLGPAGDVPAGDVISPRSSLDFRSRRWPPAASAFARYY